MLLPNHSFLPHLLPPGCSQDLVLLAFGEICLHRRIGNTLLHLSCEKGQLVQRICDVKWTRKAKPRTNTCLWCFAEFTSIRDDAHTCSPRCRMAFSRSREEAELRDHLAQERDFERLKRFRSLRRENKVYQQWALERKAFEKRISQALLQRDSEQLVIAFHEMRMAPFKVHTRRLVFYPYRSFARYCRERWHLNPKKVETLINPFINPVISRSQQK